MPDANLAPGKGRKQPRSMEEVNREEIDRLRERTHQHGNVLQEHAGHLERIEAGMGNLDRKLDAIHLSINGKIAEMKADVKDDQAEIKQDLSEIKLEVKTTNGRVAEHDRQISMLRGGLVVIAAGWPVVTGLVIFAVQQLVL